MSVPLLLALAVIPAIADSDCRNGGKPVHSANSSLCICPPNFSGRFCEQTTSITCQHGKPLKHGCFCDSGFEGEFCEKPICRHGNRTEDGLACECDPGWMGLRCHERVCAIGGRWSLLEGRCVCDQFWVGDRCETKVCVHGTLLYKIGGDRFCHCLSGWTGSHCHKSICNHGIFKNNKCTCARGWEGSGCDLIKCYRGVRISRSVCLCFPPFSGQHCDLCVSKFCPGKSRTWTTTRATTTQRPTPQPRYPPWLSDGVTGLISVVFVFFVILVCACCCQWKARQRRSGQREDLSLQPSVGAAPLQPTQWPNPLDKPPSYSALHLDAQAPPTYEESLRVLFLHQRTNP